MTDGRTISIQGAAYDASEAVPYHYGKFPPREISLERVFAPITRAIAQLTRYDEKLRQMKNSALLLAPLRERDAMVSSRMEGTISTLEEVLRLQASESAKRGDEGARHDVVEVALYARALRQAERQIADGLDISEYLIKTAHQTLLSHGRGADRRPGQYKTQQNYVGDRRAQRVDYIPVAPENLGQAMGDLMRFIAQDPRHALLKTAIAHAEFEALHPFDDGNGRVGRMLIPLMLWRQGVLSAPHFFVSDYFERNKDAYIDSLRRISAADDWTQWCVFFLTALEAQAEANIEMLERVDALYQEMLERVRAVLRSQHFVAAVDFIFANPIFWNNHFVEAAKAPASTLRNFTPRLVKAGVLSTVIEPAGRAPGLYAFPALLDIIDAA